MLKTLLVITIVAFITWTVAASDGKRGCYSSSSSSSTSQSSDGKVTIRKSSSKKSSCTGDNYSSSSSSSSGSSSSSPGQLCSCSTSESVSKSDKEDTKCPNPNEVYDPCPAVCPPQECGVDPAVILCQPNPQPGDPACKPGCRCKDGFLRNDQGICIPKDQCSKKLSKTN